MLFQGINVVSLYVPDLVAARHFYQDILGFGPPVYDMPEIGWVEFETGGPGNLAITTDERTPATGSRATVVLTTEDCASTCNELRRRGVRCDEPVVVPNVIVHCTFYDPFGNRLQMCSEAPRA